jgi:uncharacterized membrane protein
MKKWYISKTLWVNLIALIAMVAQGISGKEIIDLDAQAVILAGINFILRIATKQQITW